MLFFKTKHRQEELLLPPPPPLPTLEPEEELKEYPTEEIEEEKPKFFDEVIKPEEPETIPEENEFNDLVQDLDKELKPGKSVIKKREKLTLKKGLKQKISKQKIQKQLKKQQPKHLKKAIKKIKSAKAKPKEEFGLEGMDFKLPKELREEESIKLPENLDEFDLGDTQKALSATKSIFDEGIGQEAIAKPKAIAEAEEEIKSAIENIKKQEMPSLFKRLFSKKQKAKESPAEEFLTQETPKIDDISAIQNNIKMARDSLARFDLEAARRAYIDIMRIYNSLKPEDQAKVYGDIKELYFERKSAEELKV